MSVSTPIDGPASRPCGSCPYRCDVPSGVWGAEEYTKLVKYDAETWAQPLGVFLCHQQDGRLCAGWVACIDVEESLAVRLAAAHGTVDVDGLRDYTTPVPTFATGLEAARHGLANVMAPGDDARRAIAKLERQRARLLGG